MVHKQDSVNYSNQGGCFYIPLFFRFPMTRISGLLLTIISFVGGPLIAQVPAQTIPEFSFLEPNRSIFSQKDIRPDRMAFFVFFDCDCEHCQKAVQYIDQRQQDLKEISIYLISLDEFDKIDQFLLKFGPRLRKAKNVKILRDQNNQFIARFKPIKYPSMFLYSTDRKLIDYEDNEETVFRFINDLKKETRK
jgi:hypothetical protein